MGYTNTRVWVGYYCKHVPTTLMQEFFQKGHESLLVGRIINMKKTVSQNDLINFHFETTFSTKRKCLHKIFFILVFFFSSLTLANENIKQFRIEGIRLGDSVIDHFPGRDVVSNITSKYDHLSDEFHVSELYRHKNFKKYDEVHLVIKSDSEDILFPIYGISGLIYYEKDIENCYTEKDKLVKELGTIFKNDIETGVVKVKWSHLKHPSDLSGQSDYEESKFYFDWGFARITCYDMAAHMGISDALTIDIFFQEVDDWLNKIQRSI